MVYQLKISLDDVKNPRVWRRVLVPEDITFHELHQVIQSAMGWANAHLYKFGEKAYGGRLDIGPSREDHWSEWTHDSKKTLVCQILNPFRPKLKYVYDFGDDWIHSIVLEKTFEDGEVKEKLPYCLKAQGKCPPEDCCGPWGYEELKSLAIAESEGKKIHKEDAERLDWYDVEIDEVLRKSMDTGPINKELDSLKFKKKRKAKIDTAKVEERTELLGRLTSGFISQRMQQFHHKYCDEVLSELKDSGIDITRGAPEIWAAALIVDTAECDFIDEEPTEPISRKEICEYFKVKESSMLNRLNTIRENTLTDDGYGSPFDMLPGKMQFSPEMMDMASVMMQNPDIMDKIDEAMRLMENEDIDVFEAVMRVLHNKK